MNGLGLISGKDDDTVLSELYRLGTLEPSQVEVESAVVRRLLQSPNPLIRERAIFVFGIRGKSREFCDDFRDMLASEAPINYPVISALILSAYQIPCMLNLTDISHSFQSYIRDQECLEVIGQLLVGFVFLTSGSLSYEDFKGYIVKEGRPSDNEINAALRLLQ